MYSQVRRLKSSSAARQAASDLQPKQAAGVVPPGLQILTGEQSLRCDIQEDSCRTPNQPIDSSMVATNLRATHRQVGQDAALLDFGDPSIAASSRKQAHASVKNQ
mmetsp:Transcript_39854/g.60200  ORF Transcript_39854/g.60200 Transcript_39854/m.60200 type:complete len:105 (+) Transcript_39854:137-451(+)